MKPKHRAPGSRAAAGLLAIALAGIAAPAAACSPARPLDGGAAREAKQVFVFQLTATRVAKSAAEVQGTVHGEIRVLNVLRGGTAPVSTNIRFQTGECGGARLGTGHYYVAFVQDARPGWWAGRGTLIHLGGLPPQSGDAALAEVQRMLDGRIALERSSLLAGRDFVDSGWPPPLPLPPSKPAKPRSK